MISRKSFSKKNYTDRQHADLENDNTRDRHESVDSTSSFVPERNHYRPDRESDSRSLDPTVR